MAKPSDPPKFHLFWYSTGRGVSNEDGEKKRLYYGKTFRVPRDLVDDNDRLVIEQREMDDLEERAIRQSCMEGGKPAAGEFMERYDVFDVETGDAIVMYRLPYQPDDEKPIRPTTAPPAMSRRARRAAGKQDGASGHVLPAPPNASDEARVLIGRLLHLLDKHAGWKMPGDLAAEQRALALQTVAAHELASVRDSAHKRAIVSQMGEWFRWLIDEHVDAPAVPTLDEDTIKDLEAQGVARRIDIGPDDTGETH